MAGKKKRLLLATRSEKKKINFTTLIRDGVKACCTGTKFSDNLKSLLVIAETVKMVMNSDESHRK